MPSLTPFGGISLLAHALINVAASAYRTIRSVFRRFKRASRSATVIQAVQNATVRPGVSFGTRVFAYSIVGSMFVFFVGTGMLILSLISSAQVYTFAINTVSVVESHSALFAEVHYTAPHTLSGDPQPTAPSPYAEATGSDPSIINILSDAGYSDNSFAGRASLAAELQVVGSPEQYEGTPKQNKDFIAAFEKMIGMDLTLDYQTTTLSYNDNGKIN